jgi:hypothetical protein
VARSFSLSAFDNRESRLNPSEFNGLFLAGFRNYPKTQALEILPLLAAYNANLAAQAGGLQFKNLHPTYHPK